MPLYVLFKRVQRADGSTCALEITYATFYAFNGPYSIGCCQPFCFEAGAHDGDWEHFTVRCGSCRRVAALCVPASGLVSDVQGLGVVCCLVGSHRLFVCGV